MIHIYINIMLFIIHMRYTHRNYSRVLTMSVYLYLKLLFYFITINVNIQTNHRSVVDLHSYYIIHPPVLFTESTRKSALLLLNKINTTFKNKC